MLTAELSARFFWFPRRLFGLISCPWQGASSTAGRCGGHLGRATLCIPQIDVAQRDARRLDAAAGCVAAPEAVVTAANPVDRRPEGGWRGGPTQACGSGRSSGLTHNPLDLPAEG